MKLRIEQDGDDVLLWVKAVPGASRNQVAGLVGDRLKIRISSPPEGGKANQAICKTLASALGIKTGRVSIEKGSTHPEKIMRIEGESIESVLAMLEG